MSSTSRSCLALLALIALAARAAPAQDAPAVVAEAPAAFAPASPESQGLDPGDLEALADVIRGYVADGVIVGGELLVIKNRRTVMHEAFGDVDREAERPWALDTICNIRSMTKPLTGAAAQILIDEGKLGIDDPVAKYLPAFDNEASRAITVRQLMTHRSGLPLTVVTRSYDEYDDLLGLADAAGERGPDFEPGSQFWYSDTASDVLGAVVEVVAQQPLEVFVRERILEPLGMGDTFRYRDPGDPRQARVAPLYVGAVNNWRRFWTPEDESFYPFAVGSQSLFGTCRDYAHFLAMWMDVGVAGDRPILSPEAVERTLTPVSRMKVLGADAPMPTGYPGLETHYGQMAIVYLEEGATDGAEPVAFGHSGSDGTYAVAWPDLDLMVLYFTQSRGQATAIRFEETIDRHLIHPGVERVVEIVPAEYTPYLGTYIADFGLHANEPFKVIFRDGGLALDIPSQMVFPLLEPDEEGRWLFQISSEIAVTFHRDEAGSVNLLRIHQAGMTMDVPREGTKLAAEMAAAMIVDEATVAPFLGRYHDPEDDTYAEVRYRDGSLFIDVPDVMEFQLMPPDVEGWWAVRINPALRLRFNVDESGRAVSMTRLMGGEELDMPRVEEGGEGSKS
jgi:CubicO group peptidase (beta-lactamase class C family)